MRKKVVFKEYSKEKEVSFPLIIQLLCTEAVLIFAIVTFIEPAFLPAFYISVGTTLIVLAFNNYYFFRRSNIKVVAIIISFVYAIIAGYFISYALLGI